MTWLVVLVAALGLGGFIVRGRRPSRPQQLAVALTLASGLLGYAATGHPDTRASDERTIVEAEAFDPARSLLVAATGDTAAWLTYADALGRGGKTLAAIRGLERALGDDPGNSGLWTELGLAYCRHDDGRLGSGAEFAFRRAEALAGRNPAPAFFHGRAALRSGDPARALKIWATIPPAPDAAWAPLLAAEIAAATAMRR